MLNVVTGYVGVGGEGIGHLIEFPTSLILSQIGSIFVYEQIIQRFH